MPIAHINNSELKTLDASRFRRLNNPVHAWGDVSNMVLSLPGLVGYWPGAVDGGTPLLLDVSKNGLHLTRNGSAVVSLTESTPFVPYLKLGGTGEYFSHADDARLDILGTEAIVASSSRGLTVAAWVYLNDIDSSLDQGIIAKWVSSGQSSYLLGAYEAIRSVAFSVSNDGTTVDAVANTDFNTLEGDVWFFLAGRFDPSTSISVWWNSVSVTVNSGIPASIFQSTSNFTIGEVDGVSTDGRIALPWICASALPDVTIEAYYQMTAPLFAKQV